MLKVGRVARAEDRAKAPRSLLAELLEVVLLALGLYLIIQFAIQTVHVIGFSMYPTVDDGDYLIATKVDYHFHNPQRGDVIIMRDPYDQSRDFIKRVVGVPGDRILVRDGQVYINGHKLIEPYVNHEPPTQYANWPPAQAAEPSGHLLGGSEYFVMGDNRNHSDDSRVFGPIQRSQIESHAWIRILPLSQFGQIDGARPRLASQVTLPQAA